MGTLTPRRQTSPARNVQHKSCQVTDTLENGVLYQITSERRADAPRRNHTVLITHGAFSNHETAAPLGRFLTEQGFHTYVVEWRGREMGVGASVNFRFQDIAGGELRDAVTILSKRHGTPVHVIGHSGGGIAFAMMLADHPETRRLVRSLTTIASQASQGAIADGAFKAALRTAYLSGRFIGLWPARLVRLGPSNESEQFMRQWALWRLSGQFKDDFGQDYLAKMPRALVPALGIAGEHDRVICPSEGCEALVSAFGGDFMCFGPSHGHDGIFDHSRVFLSKDAAKFVWPRLAAWIRSHDHPRENEAAMGHQLCYC